MRDGSRLTPRRDLPPRLPMKSRAGKLPDAEAMQRRESERRGRTSPRSAPCPKSRARPAWRRDRRRNGSALREPPARAARARASPRPLETDSVMRQVVRDFARRRAIPPRPTRRAGSRPPATLRRCRFRLLLGGKAELEFRSNADSAVDGDVTAHSAREIAADRQAESGAFARAGECAPDLHERREDRFQLVLRYSRARIEHRQDDGVSARLARESDLPARVRKLDRVRDEIQHDLLDFRAIGERHGTVATFLVVEFQSL